MSSAAAGRFSMKEPRCTLSQKHNVDYNNRRWESRLSPGSRVSSLLLVRVCSRIALSAAASGFRDPRAFAGVPLHTEQAGTIPAGAAWACRLVAEDSLSAIVMHEPEPLPTFLRALGGCEFHALAWRAAVVVPFEASRGLFVLHLAQPREPMLNSFCSTAK